MYAAEVSQLRGLLAGPQLRGQVAPPPGLAPEAMRAAMRLRNSGYAVYEAQSRMQDGRQVAQLVTLTAVHASFTSPLLVTQVNKQSQS